jgi:hypothetical protein
MWRYSEHMQLDSNHIHSRQPISEHQRQMFYRHIYIYIYQGKLSIKHFIYIYIHI